MANTKFVYLGIVIVGLIGLNTGGVLDTSMKVMAQDNMTEMAGIEEASQE